MNWTKKGGEWFTKSPSPNTQHPEPRSSYPGEMRLLSYFQDPVRGTGSRNSDIRLSAHRPPQSLLLRAHSPAGHSKLTSLKCQRPLWAGVFAGSLTVGPPWGSGKPPSCGQELGSLGQERAPVHRSHSTDAYTAGRNRTPHTATQRGREPAPPGSGPP